MNEQYPRWRLFIDPPISDGHQVILVGIKYFTKWVETASYKSVTMKIVSDFLRDHIICRFGVPKMLITDNARNLNNDMIDRLCKQFKIKHWNSTIYRPQMNGVVEAANKNLKKIIHKMTKRHRNWHEKLPYALMAYRTVIRTSIGAMPYSLMYGLNYIRFLKEQEISNYSVKSDLHWSNFIAKELASLTQSAKDALKAVEESVRREFAAAESMKSRLNASSQSSTRGVAEQPSDACQNRAKKVITIQDKDGPKQFRVFVDDKFERLFKMYADKVKLDLQNLVFCFDGVKLVLPQPLLGLKIEMEENDIIEVHVKRK
nr:uncharacterized protein LOC113711416 [Coffea arabica]